MLLNIKAKAKSLRLRTKGPETEARGYEARPRPTFWPRGFNISAFSTTRLHCVTMIATHL